jgi:drug/metabolite transporter (DMT)-like permease
MSWKTLPELIALLGAGPIAPESFINGLITILYGGFVSVGIAYTLQAVAQKDAPPAHATIILCLEGVFAALGGMLLLREKPGPWTLLGFALMFCGMLATQFDVIVGRRKQ